MESFDFLNPNKPTVSILGSCIIRDAWGMGKQFGDYTIKQFIQSNSPFSCFSLPLSELTDQIIEEKDMSNTAPVWYRWFCINAYKTLKISLLEKKSDWLIFNLTEISDNLVRVENNKGKITWLDNSRAITGNKLFENKKFSKLKTKLVSSIDFAKSDKIDGGYNSIVKMTEVILSCYKPEQIIFVDILPAKQFITKDSKIEDFNIYELEEKSVLINECSKQFINLVKPHVIKVPENVLGDELHQWGKSPFHYIPELYEYLLNAYTVIMKKFPDEQSVLSTLYNEYKDIFSKRAELLCEKNNKSVKENINQAVASKHDSSMPSNKSLARIDFKNFGSKVNSVQVIKASDNSVKAETPAWFKNETGQGLVLQSSAGKIDFELKCAGNGKLKIWLRGIDLRDKNGSRIPVWINYTAFCIGKKNILKAPELTWHDKPFVYELPVKDGKILTVHAEWQLVD